MNGRAMPSSATVASMARLAGRAIVGSEAWTWAGTSQPAGRHAERSQAGQRHGFSLRGQRSDRRRFFPIRRASAGTPGWMPYYGPVLGPGNPQWRFFPALAAYLNRCQWLLRQGTPVPQGGRLPACGGRPVRGARRPDAPRLRHPRPAGQPAIRRANSACRTPCAIIPISSTG